MASVSIVNETSHMICIVHRFVDVRNGRDPLSGVDSTAVSGILTV